MPDSWTTRASFTCSTTRIRSPTCKEKLDKAGFTNVTAWGSSYRHLNSYNWNLRTILEHHKDLRFDYIYLDGAHTWAVDALTFLLCDRLLNVGGFHFDDYGWRLRGSSLDPVRVPVTAELYTDAQIDDLQVKAIVDLLVRGSGTYREVVTDRLFQKIAADPVRATPGAGALDRGRPLGPRAASVEFGAPHLFHGELETMTRVMRSGHRRYQEFGIGGSTLLALRSGLETIVAVDSDPQWIGAARENREISQAIEAGRVCIRHADIGPVQQWGHPRDRSHMQNWPSYIATAWDVWSERGEFPDLVFVDGRFRVACCLSTILLAAASGTTGGLRVMLHDVGPQRAYYDEVFRFFDVVRVGEHTAGAEDQAGRVLRQRDGDPAALPVRSTLTALAAGLRRRTLIRVTTRRR